MNISIAAGSATLALAMASTPSAAANLGGLCCSDLEARIAELELVASHNDKRNLSLSISGQVNQAILGWDDGRSNGAVVAGNKNDQSNFAFTGQAALAPGWTAGYEIVLRLNDGLSDGLSQISDDAPGEPFQIWQSNWNIESEHYGRLSLGTASRVSDTAPEHDLSGTGVAGYAGVQDIGGGFFLARSDRRLSAVTWGDIYNHMNGDTGTVVRYDSPAIAGLTFAWSWGEDDIWDAGASFAREADGMVLEAAIAYSQSTDENGLDGGGDTPNTTLAGSLTVLHEPSGLNVTIAGGQREFDVRVEDADGQLHTPADAKFAYLKTGWLTKFSALGSTAFYAEYGWFKDFLSAGADADSIASLSFTDAAVVCAAPGAACRIAGSEAGVAGLGAVQEIESAAMQVYIGWRRHTADFNVVDFSGAKVHVPAIEDFDTLIAGSHIAF